MSITGANNPFSCTPVVFSAGNQILQLGTITRDGNEFTFSVGFKWKINGVTYQNTAPVVLTIAEASEGFYRIDNAILNTSNSIELQQGLESETIALQPVVPDTNILLTSWNISGTTIGTPIDPITGGSFVEKLEANPFISNVSGTDAIIPLDPNGYSEIRLQNSGLVSIAGYDLSLITGNANAKVPYPGKPYIIRNLTGNNITIKNELSSADYPFYLTSTTDLVFPNNQAIYVSYDGSGFIELFKSWTDIDLSEKADLVGGKVPASQLPSYVDDVLEFANLAAFPVTGETGKIYVALDTNKTYRWSGSAYVQISDNTKLDKSTTPSSIYATDASGNQEMISKDSFKNLSQVTITTSRSALASDNGCLVKIKGNATYTINTSTLPTGWNIIVRTFAGATGTFVAGGSTTNFDAPTGLILRPLRMCSIIKDSDDNKILINGETTLT